MNTIETVPVHSIAPEETGPPVSNDDEWCPDTGD